MAELRKFKFFDLELSVDKGKLASAFKDTTLTVATSGRTLFIFGDGEGNLVILDKLVEYSIFKAYNVQITHAEFIKHSPYLITVGDDEPGINPVLKIWNIDLKDKGGSPMCVRVSRLIPNQKAVKVTAVGVHDSATLMAVGFENGSVLLFRGNVVRDRNNKPKLLKETGSNPITGLAFRTNALMSYLFITTQSSVLSFDITNKDKEKKWVLDSVGCSVNCCAMADLPHEAHFMVANENAVFCYTADGRGPCFPMLGEKVYVQWFKSFLAVVAKESKSTHDFITPVNSESSIENYTVTILDIHNNFIVSQTTLPGVIAVLVRCGSFYIITQDLQIHHLAEKDIQSKMSLLFKKNFYDIAIKMAKSQHYDEDGLAEIFRQYGDHLNGKGDRAGAIEQYIKTIGKLEPSYIIRKFMDSAHMEQLMEYLQALHKKGAATGDHTTLLLNCYIKLGKATDLKDFIMTKGTKVDFDIDIALKVVRGVSAEDALSLATAHNSHQWVVRILVEDLKRYKDAVVYLSSLQFYDAEKCIMDFGGVLVEHAPSEMTNYLKELCIKYSNEVKPSQNQFLDFDGVVQACRPQNFLHLFLRKSEYLVEFLEHLVNAKSDWDTQIYNVLIEHYLVIWSKSNDSKKSSVEQRVMKILSDPDVPYDRQQVFILCEMHNFSPGRILLYEENKLYYQVIQSYVADKKYKEVLSACRRFGNQDPNIWIHALWAVAQNSDTPQHVLSEIMSVIDQQKLQPPIMTVEALGEGITLGQARRYFASILQAEDELLAKETEIIEEHSEKTAKTRSRIKQLESNAPIIFKGSQCNVCQAPLQLPSVHFLCQHSYHQRCLLTYSENENECIVCQKDNKRVIDTIQLQKNSHELHQTFHTEFKKSNDSFEVVGRYFGRSVFNNVSLPNPGNSAMPPSRSSGNISSLMSVPSTTSSKASQEQKERVQRKKEEPDRIAFNVREKVAEQPMKRSDELSSSLVTKRNPFDDESDFDDRNNPFADDADDEDSAPGYNDELNPFA